MCKFQANSIYDLVLGGILLLPYMHKIDPISDDEDIIEMELFLFALFCLSGLRLLYNLQQDLHMCMCFCCVSVHGCVTWRLVKLGTKTISVSELISCMITLSKICGNNGM